MDDHTLDRRKPAYTQIAAVDLGTNSFRLQIARVQDGHLLLDDSLREMVRLGSGLDEKDFLNDAAIERAVACLKRFGERLRGLPQDSVRVVATNTFRVAQNAAQLLEACQTALGFPIEIIAGREEARMIYIGVSHGLPLVDHKRLVVDIGGGSTEFIIGEKFNALETESLYMGCVSYSMRFFPDGKITEGNLTRAEIAARAEIQTIRTHFSAKHWQEAIGSSGTARVLGEVLAECGLSNGLVTFDGLNKLRPILLKAKDSKKLPFTSLSPERAPVFIGGYAIMYAVFAELGVDSMSTAHGALREGVLYELLGRMQHQDTRELTVRSFMRRYHVDFSQAKRVQVTALSLLERVKQHLKMEYATATRYLSWASRLHEIGVSIAHTGYHKHSAYIVENADMAGFSNREQQALGVLVRCQRRGLPKPSLWAIMGDHQWMVMILRLSVLFHRNRLDERVPVERFGLDKSGYVLSLKPGWLAENPLTQAALESELNYWQEAGINFLLEQ